MPASRLSVTEFAVLGILAEEPTHGFAISKRLEPGTEVGRVMTVRRPLVYRALDRLVELGYAESIQTERGEGPQRVVHRITRSGRRRLNVWLSQPVDHVRDLRIEFLLKLALLRRSDMSPLGLIESQRRALGATLEALEVPTEEPADHVELWRRHNAAAAMAYLEELATKYS